MNDVAAGHLPTRDDLERLQAAMLQLPQVECTTRHHFAEGLYCRQMDWPQGVLIVGKAHRKEHLFVLLTGRAAISTDTGVQEVSAPFVIVAPPHIKRVGVALENCTVLNIYATPNRDLAELEIELVHEEAESPYDFNNQLKPDYLEKL